jgi:AraC-like DNA-binding protein
MSRFASIVQGRDTWNAHCRIPRHRHEPAYAAVVLAGAYQESGSRGRYRVGSGQVLLHRSFEAHVDRFESQGAHILNLLLDEEPLFELGFVRDPDAIARAAERDAAAAARGLREQLAPIEPPLADWPDLLARDLLEDPQLRLDEWAERHGLTPATVSRGFGKVFETSPAAFRAEARAHRAWAQMAAGGLSLAGIAAGTGFADQAHMTRAIRALTGRPPGHWLRSNWFKTQPMASSISEA